MEEVNKVINQFEGELKRLKSPPFTQSGFENYKDKLSEYITLLFEESSRISNRSKADLISAIHVENAANHLISKSKSKWKNLLTTIGGILIGNAISTVVTMNAFDVSYSTAGISIILILGVLGAFFMGYAMLK